MSDVLTDAVTYLQGLARGLTGMRSAPNKPPDSSSLYPFAVSICRHVPWNVGEPAGQMSGICTFGTQIHTDRSDAPRDYLAVHHFGVDYPKAVWADVKLGGKVNNVTGVRARFAVMKFGGIDTIGWDIEVDALVHLTLP